MKTPFTLFDDIALARNWDWFFWNSEKYFTSGAVTCDFFLIFGTQSWYISTTLSDCASIMKSGVSMYGYEKPGNRHAPGSLVFAAAHFVGTIDPQSLLYAPPDIAEYEKSARELDV